MAVSSNASIEIELGTPSDNAAAALTNSGDDITFTFGGSPLSKQSGYAPVVMLAGLKTGGVVTGNATNNEIAYTAMTAIHGSAAAAAAATGLVSKTAGTVTLTRASTASYFIINSITLKSDGTVNATVGTEGAALSATRAAAGGPPLIPADSIEIAQVKMETSTAAVITASEIFQIPGTSQERHNSPLWTTDVFDGEVTFNSALPDIHVGPTHAEVYGKYATPAFSEIGRAADFVPAEQTATANSTTRYQGAETGRTVTQNAGSFTVFLDDGLTDTVLGAKNDTRWMRFKPNKDNAAHRLENGYVTISRTFPPDNQVQATFAYIPDDYGRDYDS